MPKVPSPADVASQYAATAHAIKDVIDFDDAASSAPELLDAVANFGIEVESSLSRWQASSDPIGSGALLASHPAPASVARWLANMSRHREPKPPLLAYLVAEARLKADTAAIAAYLHSLGTSLAEVYVELNAKLGGALVDAAFETTWQRRAIFNRTLDAARAYLVFTRQHELWTGSTPDRGVATRLATSVVLGARFGDVGEEDLRNARTTLLEAHESGSEHAFTHYLEATTWLYDLYDDEEALIQTARRALPEPAWESSRLLACSHIWLRLVGIATTARTAHQFLDYGRQALFHLHSGSLEGRKEDAASALLLGTMFDFLNKEIERGRAIGSTRHIRFPFGIRRPSTPMPDSFNDALPLLIRALALSDLHGAYLFRDLQAQFHSRLARSRAISAHEQRASLLEAITLRTGRGHASRPIPRINADAELASDQCLLATHAGYEHHRRSALLSMLPPAAQAEPSARHLTFIAREIDANGPLKGALLEPASTLTVAIREGDTRTLFAMAASAAYASADHARVSLGGRSGVVSIRDSDGTEGQTFVFKTMTFEARDRDAENTKRVEALLRTTRLTDKFGVIEHLAEVNINPSDTAVDDVTTVRRYTSGKILKDILAEQAPPSQQTLLASVAQFLAHIQYANLGELINKSPRKEVKEREFGRWLRSLIKDDDERSELFAAWWDAAKGAPLVPRRDAHAMNWLVAPDSRILAVDLESQGARPWGYELAQLIEDCGSLSPELHDARSFVIKTYANTWSELTGDPIDEDQASRFYELGAIARAVRSISAGDDSNSNRYFGGKLLREIGTNTRFADVRAIAARLVTAWNEVTGLAGEADFEVLSDAARARISRAMSYHLRHDREIEATKDGWVHVDELAAVLRKTGHKVDSQQIILIAGALGEPRFELDGVDVRAAYGHSMPVEMKYLPKRPPAVLYHATPLSNLTSIFAARSGLRKGRRNWVHLTASCAVAVRAAQRQKESVAVLEVNASLIDGLVHASGSTWLAPAVPIECLSVASLRTVSDAVTTVDN